MNTNDRRTTGFEDGTRREAAGMPMKVARWVLTIAGLLLLLLAGLANYSSDYLFAARWMVFIRLPGMAGDQYYFFPIFYVLVGLPLVCLGIGMLSRTFRRALASPWRSASTALPLVFVLLFFAFTMFPWEFSSTRVEETGSRLVFYLTLGGCGAVLFMAGFYDKLRFLDRPMREAYDWVMALDRRVFMLVLFGVTFLATNLISLLVFEHMPHVQDSTAQLFQARIFASGRLYLVSPRFPGFFDFNHVINNGQWYSQYPFLHSLLIAPFALVGVPWIANPVLGSLTVPVIYLLGREVYSERTGRLAGLLACLSPFVLCMSSEFMNGASALLFSTLFVLFYFRTLNRGKWRHALLSGVFIGMVVNVRPLTALAVSVPFVAHGVYRMVREPGRMVPRFALALAAAGAVGSLTLVYNWLANGDPMLFGYVVKWGEGHEIGFGKSGWGDQHTPMRGLVNTGNDMNALNRYLFEWPMAALLPLLMLFAAGTKDRRDWLLLGCLFSLSGAYFFYWFHNICLGPRFIYEASGCVLILTVRGAERLASFLQRVFRVDSGDVKDGRFVGRLWPVLTLLMLVLGLPPLLQEYHGYGGVRPTTQRSVRRAGIGNAVVFLHHLSHGFNANRLDLTGDIVYAKDFGLLNSALTLAYPGREYWYANEDTLRRLDGIEYPRSRLKRALDEMGSFLDDSTTVDYRTVVWPIADIPIVGRDGQTLEWNGGPEATDFRLASREIFSGRRTFRSYLPMVACWIVGDDREHLRIFSYMDDLQNCIAGEFKFTLLRITSEGTGAVFDIRRVTGDEQLLPGQRSPVMVR